MRVSIIDGKIVGYNTIAEQAKIWGTTPAAIKQMVKRNLINPEDYICILGNSSTNNAYFFAEDLEKPTRKTKCGDERRLNGK